MALPKNAKNDEYARHERRRRVAALYLSGKGQHDIARQLGCVQGTVSKDLAAVRKQWIASTLRDFDTKQAEELARLDRLEAEAWAAWERSCEPLLKGPKRPGDARFLQEARKCVELRLRVIGALAPETQVNVTQAVINWDALYERPQQAPDPLNAKLAELEALPDLVPPAAPDLTNNNFAPTPLED